MGPRARKGSADGPSWSRRNSATWASWLGRSNGTQNVCGKIEMLYAAPGHPQEKTLRVLETNPFPLWEIATAPNLLLAPGRHRTWLRCTKWTFDLNYLFNPKLCKAGFAQKQSIIQRQWYLRDGIQEVTEGACTHIVPTLCLGLSWHLLRLL